MFCLSGLTIAVCDNYVMQKGFGYVLSTPQYVVSFSATLFGLLALAIFTAYLAKNRLEQNKFRV